MTRCSVSTSFWWDHSPWDTILSVKCWIYHRKNLKPKWLKPSTLWAKHPHNFYSSFTDGQGLTKQRGPQSQCPVYVCMQESCFHMCLCKASSSLLVTWSVIKCWPLCQQNPQCSHSLICSNVKWCVQKQKGACVKYLLFFFFLPKKG